MAENKTTANALSVDDFIAGVADPVRQADAVELRALMERASGHPAVMWGPAIVGFGSFHYTARSSEGEWMVVGFSPRKAALTLYGLIGAYDENPSIAESLGKHTTSKGCIYIKRLSDVDLAVLESLVRAAMEREPAYEG